MILRKKCFVRIHDWTVSRPAAPALSVLFYDFASSPPATVPLPRPAQQPAPMNNGVSAAVVHTRPP